MCNKIAVVLLPQILKIEIVKKAFALLFVLCCFSAYTFGQNLKELREVEVSSSRSGSTFEKNARAVTLITGEDIENAPVMTVDELLSYSVNLDMRSRGYFNQQTDISMRGSSFDQVLILINGIKMNDPQTGHHNFDLPVTIEDIDHIEILYGGASRVYGVNAFAGAINIITKNEESNSLSGGVSMGQNGLHEYRGSGTLAYKNHSHRLSVINRDSDGYIENTDFSNTNLFWQSEVHKGNFDMIFNAGYTTKEFGSQNFYSAAFPDQFSAVNVGFGSLQAHYQTGSKGLITARTYLRRNQSRFELFREGEDYYRRTGENRFVRNGDTLAPWYTGHNYHDNRVFGSELNYTYDWKAGKTNVGVEYRDERIYSNNLGTQMNERHSVTGEPDYAFYDKQDRRGNVSAFIEHSVQLKKWFISGGAMMNINSDFGNNIFPGLDVSYMLNNYFKPYVSANRSMRFPTFTDLYYSLGNAQGSENLMPENSMNYEAGTYFYGKGISGRVSLFRREGQNMIDWVRFSGSDTAFASNITQINFNGAEVDARINLKTYLGEKFPLTQLTMSYSYMYADSASEGFESNYVLDFLQHNANLSLAASPFKGFFVAVSSSFQKRLGSYVTPGGKEIEFPDVWLLNLRLQQKIKFANVFVEASNLFDKKFVDVGNVQMPGRWIRGGVSFKLTK